MSDSEALPHVASQEAVKEAIKLLQSKAAMNKRKRNAVEEEQNRRLSSHCTLNLSDGGKNKSLSSTVFSRNLVVNEMQICLARQDWQTLQDLFYYLLDTSFELEPLVWRYFFIILLHSPASSSQNIRELLEQCLGSQGSDNCLQKLLSMQHRVIK